MQHKHKYFPQKIAGLLTISLALMTTPALASEGPLPQTAGQTEAAAEAPHATDSFYRLDFDAKNFTKETLELNGLPVAFRAFRSCHYTAYPVSDAQEQMDIYIPEAYFNKKKINGYTARTAPVFMPLTIKENESGSAASPEDEDSIALQALAHGYVVAAPAAMSVIPQEEHRLGKAPVAILDYKAAIRYLRRNHHRLPAGDLGRIVVTGQGVGGNLALQLAASTDREIFHPYLRSLGAAERSDRIFAAQVYQPDLNLTSNAARFGWTLPDGRPDPNAASRYTPLLDPQKALEPQEELFPVPQDNVDSPEALADEAGKDLIPENAPASEEEAAKDESSPAPAKIIYDTKEYRDYLQKKATYEEVLEETKQVREEYKTEGATAPYLRVCTKDADALQNLKSTLEEHHTDVTLQAEFSPLDDLKALFTWIDEADASQDIVDEDVAKILKKQEEKLARAKLLADRAQVRAQKRQAKLERHAQRDLQDTKASN